MPSVVSIVMPALNQAGTIEAAIRSVLEQKGPFELIVIDGGSTDGTCDTIARYERHLAFWVSEPDRGQSHAINKGLQQARGDILGWLNADDLLMPGALASVREVLARTGAEVVCGACRYDRIDGRTRVQRVSEGELRRLAVYDPIHQPSCYWLRSLHERVGGLDERLHYGMDWDLWLRMAACGARFATTDDVLSVYRVTGVNKTSTGGERRNREMYAILRRYGVGGQRALTEIAYRVLWPLKRLRASRPRWLCRPISNAARNAVLVALGPMMGFDRVRCCTHPFF